MIESTIEFNAVKQWQVLKCVLDKNGIDGAHPEPITDERFTSNEISTYVNLLTQLGFVRSKSYYDPTGFVHIPICVTADGIKCLSETDKQFWDDFQSAAAAGIGTLIGIDVNAYIEFFRNAYKNRNKV